MRVASVVAAQDSAFAVAGVELVEQYTVREFV